MSPLSSLYSGLMGRNYTSLSAGGWGFRDWIAGPCTMEPSTKFIFVWTSPSNNPALYRLESFFPAEARVEWKPKLGGSLNEFLKPISQTKMRRVGNRDQRWEDTGRYRKIQGRYKKSASTGRIRENAPRTGLAVDEDAFDAMAQPLVS